MDSQASEGKPTQVPQNGIEKDVSNRRQPASAGDTDSEPPFSIYGPREKKFIVLMASLAALLSPLSANIYYPALNILAAELSVSLALINLTITAYLVSGVDVSWATPYNAGSTSDIPRNCTNIHRINFG